MSVISRREYLAKMHQRYRGTRTKAEKGAVIDELVAVLGYHRKYTIAALQHSPQPAVHRRRQRHRRYFDALSAIALAWEALDFCCAERLHPVLLSTAEVLQAHGEITLEAAVLDELSRLSRATLARYLTRLDRPWPRLPRHPSPLTQIRSAVPIERYAWDESRPGALEIDLGEHNGGSSLGHFAYTLSVVDVVSGWNARRAILGRSQKVVPFALGAIVHDWPHPLGACTPTTAPSSSTTISCAFPRPPPSPSPALAPTARTTRPTSNRQTASSSARSSATTASTPPPTSTG